MTLKKNIAIICLNKTYSKKICKAFADFVDMFFADVNDILEYNLIDNKMLETAGIDYFEKQQNKLFCTLISYENTCINCDFAILNKNDNWNRIKNNSLLLFVELTPQQLENQTNVKKTKDDFAHPEMALDVETEICKKFADLSIVSKGNVVADINEISKQITKFYNL